MEKSMISLCLLGGLAIGNGFAQTPSKPNILLIIADDCSYYDIGCFGAVNNKTPHIDALARQGIKFNSAYNSVSMSTPTRHCVYTGMYPMHHGGYANHSSVNADVKSLPTYLGNLGYRVGLAGKWHIKPLANFPFEDVPGFPKGCTSPNTDYHTKGIEKFMERDASQPFCLVLASINSHAPWTGGDASVFDRKKLQLPPQFIDTEVTREYYARYLAEVGLLDQQVGDAMQILKEKNLLQNTLVIFISEQGTQFAGAKWTNWSAGVKSAMVASWPGVIKPGMETSAIVQYEDLLPTFIDVAGGKVPDVIDGKSLVDVFQGKTKTHHKYAYHVHNNVPEGPAYPIRSISDGAVNNKTPHIDALARQGIKFNSAYNSVSMSTPTRHCVYTGMYPMHHGGYANHSSVNADVKSLPTYLGNLGYRVGLAGKWHIKPLANFPFEDVPGFPKGCTSPNTDYHTKGIEKFMERDASQPFCLVLASINSHAPWTGGDASVFDRKKLQLPPQFIDTEVTREYYARYLAEVGLLDQQVGDAMQILKEKNLLQNTLVIFISEQGTQFAGAKWTNWSAGVKSAMVASWPGVIKPGMETSAIVQYEDLLPTFIDVAGGKVPDVIDGKSLVDVFQGKTKTHHKYAYHVHNNVPEGPAYPIRSISDGRYRLIWNLTPEETYVEKHIEKAEWYLSWKAQDTDQAHKIMNRYKNRPEFELYDIKKDPFEMNNLADMKKYSKKKAELTMELQKWMKQQNDTGADKDRPRAPKNKQKKAANV